MLEKNIKFVQKRINYYVDEREPYYAIHEQPFRNCLDENAKLEFYYNMYKKHADDNNIKFSITKQEFESLFKKECMFCGMKYENSQHVDILMITLADEYEGYVFENCKSCCSECIRIKGVLNHQAFIDQCYLIAFLFADEVPLVSSTCHIPCSLENTTTYKQYK